MDVIGGVCSCSGVCGGLSVVCDGRAGASGQNNNTDRRGERTNARRRIKNMLNM